MQLDGLQQYIRYAIAQLSPQNGMADFEKACLYFGRYRIHKNILPATGPVQAGGDQGRDFETFHSYLAKSAISQSAFVADYAGKPVAFACSLEKNPTKKNGKIISDVRTITGSGVPVDRIYFFSGQDIPVAMRHKSQAEIKKLFKVELEIIDAQALAQHLSDTDLFWVATQFLKVPSEFYPERKEQNWYEELLKEYRDRPGVIASFEEFEEVKSAIRFIYKKKDLKSDLTFWLPKLDQVIEQNKLPARLVRKAIYERFVASLIGLDFVDGQEKSLKEYFEDFENFTSTSDLEDAQHLLSFSGTSQLLGRHKLPKSYLDQVTDRMEKLLTDLIKDAPTTDNKCALLEIKANFLLHDRRNDLDFVKNIDQFIAGLDELLEELPQSHFFPVGRLSDRLNEYLSIFLSLPVDLTDLEEITAEVDELLSKKAGASITGQKLRDRALVYLEAGNNAKAIEILHEVKLKWYNQDTVRGMILTCLLLAKTYQKQELFFAAKYFGMVAAYLAHKTKDTGFSDKILQGIAIAADCDYATGSWLTYLRLMSVLLGTHTIITKDFDLFDNEDSVRLLYYPSIILEAARRFLPQALPILEDALAECGPLKDQLQDVREKLKSDLDSEEFRVKINKEIKGAPFNDLGPDRQVIFNACGCDWHFSFRNDYDTNAIAEEFIATFQIFLQEVADEDLHLIPGRARIHIIVSTNEKHNIEEVTIEDKAAMLVSLTRYNGTTLGHRSKHTFDQMVYAQGLLYQQSLLPFEDYEAIVGTKIKNEDIISKITFGQAYEVLFKEFNSNKQYNNKSLAGVWNMFDADSKSFEENIALPWRGGISPKYNAEEAMEMIENRINNLSGMLSISLPLLSEAPWFQHILADLRSDGWLDWQILHSLGNIVVNHKAQFRKQPKTEDEVRQLFSDYFQKDERDWYVLMDESIIKYDRLEQDLKMMLPLVLLRSFGLENRSRIPNYNGILKLLRERFKFFDDGKDRQLFTNIN